MLDAVPCVMIHALTITGQPAQPNRVNMMRRLLSSSSRMITPLIFAVGTALTATAGAASTALRLDQALQNLAAHPRLGVSADLDARLPRRQSVYLDCQGLAFGDSLAQDPRRNQPLTALLTLLAAQQLEVMARFFDVLLADLSHASESEAVAVAYIQFDRASIRRQLGQLPELRVLELETVYQKILHRRTASEIGQQLTRALLAQSLGYPADLPEQLVDPALPSLPEVLPTLDDLVARASEGEAVRALGENRSQSDRALIALELRQQILELLFRFKALGAAERSVQAESAWREMKLDESRTLYDQEVSADLGDSMSQQTQTRLLEKRVADCRALTWAELQALAGQPIWALTPRGQ
jgi:hypothetical protein